MPIKLDYYAHMLTMLGMREPKVSDLKLRKGLHAPHIFRICFVCVVLWSIRLLTVNRRTRSSSSVFHSARNSLFVEIDTDNLVITCKPGEEQGSQCITQGGVSVVFNKKCATTVENELDLQDECDVVVDGTCACQGRRAFYHRIVDCFLNEYIFLKRIEETASNTPEQKTCIVGIKPRAGLSNALGMFRSGKRTGLVRFFDEFKCVRVTNSMAEVKSRNVHFVPNSPWQAAISQETLDTASQSHNDPCPSQYASLLTRQISATLLMKDVAFAFNGTTRQYHISSAQTTPFSQELAVRTNLNVTASVNILIVVRKGTRSFDPKILEALKRRASQLANDTEIILYTGAEQDARVVQMFYSADVIILFHGAAAANLYFSRENVICVEISTYRDLNSTIMWRNNLRLIMQHRPDIIAFNMYLPLDEAFPGAFQNSEYTEVPVHGKVVKNQSPVYMSNSAMDNMFESLQNHLLLQHRLRLTGAQTCSR